ncbi:MAG: spiro-SPASM protein [Treponema sp.]
MKSLVVLLAAGMSEYALQPLTENTQSAFSSALQRAVQLPHCAAVIITVKADTKTVLEEQAAQCLSPADQEKLIFIDKPADTAAGVFQLLLPYTDGTDTVFFSWADAPFIDITGSQDLYERHCTYKADYTFADGYPEGLFPHIFTTELLKFAAQLPAAAEMPVHRSFLFDLIKKDINAYDLETLIAPADVRHLRLHFYASSKAQYLLCRSFVGITAANYDALIAERQQALRLLPAYYGVEITAYQPLRSLYHPPVFVPPFTPDCCMPAEKAAALFQSIADFSEDAVVSLSLYGEPLLHPHIIDIVRAALSHSGISLLIETGGTTADCAVYEKLAHIAATAPARTNGHSPIYWIVCIDSVSSNMYAAVHGIEDSEEASVLLKKAVTTAEQLSTLFPHAVWTQMIRMNENEQELEPFFRFWEERQAKPLIQKYNHLCGVLPDRRVADISPLDRHPCWHLKRDMSIMYDGTVPLCKDAVGTSVVLGNVFCNSLAEIWEQGNAYYAEQINGIYKGMCTQCDEYYTYNF